jgi:hypothetical protein
MYLRKVAELAEWRNFFPPLSPQMPLSPPIIFVNVSAYLPI